jgi:hypothetical protein
MIQPKLRKYHDPVQQLHIEEAHVLPNPSHRGHLRFHRVSWLPLWLRRAHPVERQPIATAMVDIARIPHLEGPLIGFSRYMSV